MEENNKQNVSQIKLTLTESLIPIFLLIFLLSFNVYVYGDDAMSGSNQFILLIGGFVGIFLGKIKGLSFSVMINKISDNLKSVTGAIIILLFVGALSGTWFNFFTLLFNYMCNYFNCNWKQLDYICYSWYSTYWNIKSNRNSN